MYIYTLFIIKMPVLIRHQQQLKTVIFLHWCLIYAVLLAIVIKNFTKASSIMFALMISNFCFIPVTNFKLLFKKFKYSLFKFEFISKTAHIQYQSCLAMNLSFCQQVKKFCRPNDFRSKDLEPRKTNFSSLSQISSSYLNIHFLFFSNLNSYLKPNIFNIIVAQL